MINTAGRQQANARTDSSSDKHLQGMLVLTRGHSSVVRALCMQDFCEETLSGGLFSLRLDNSLEDMGTPQKPSGAKPKQRLLLMGWTWDDRGCKARCASRL